MDRRRFILSTLAAGAAPLALSARAAEDAFYAGFRAALETHPWLAAFQGVDGDLAADAVTIEGRIPAGLRGTLYRNGPALFERAGTRYHHLFDGDGMVQAYRFTDGGVSHRGRFVRTGKYLAESERGRFFYPGFGTAGGKGFAGGPDSFNVANTNVVAHAGRLFALWEAGSAYELDPETLETRGPVTWRPDLKAMPFSAHPKIEPDGTLWNMGAGPNALMLYRVGAGGKLAQAHLVKVPGLVMNHDFVVSRRYIVCVFPAIRLDTAKLRSGASFVDSLVAADSAPMRVLVIDKDDLTRQREFELPPGFVFHFGNAWDDGSNVLRFDYVHHPDARIMTEGFTGLMRGETGQLGERPSHSTHVAIDLDRGTVRTHALPGDVEFPRVDPRRVGERNRHLWHGMAMGSGTDSLYLNAVVRHDLERESSDVYRFPRDSVVEEHIVVPDPASDREGAGWLVGCTFDVKTRRTAVNVFDALRLSAGPIARAWLPYGLPVGFHGHFTATPPSRPA
jgi:carotenoid cleavage dioxygenase